MLAKWATLLPQDDSVKVMKLRLLEKYWGNLQTLFN
jgi:hypothetical protein